MGAKKPPTQAPTDDDQLLTEVNRVWRYLDTLREYVKAHTDEQGDDWQTRALACIDRLLILLNTERFIPEDWQVGFAEVLYGLEVDDCYLWLQNNFSPATAADFKRNLDGLAMLLNERKTAAGDNDVAGKLVEALAPIAGVLGEKPEVQGQPSGMPGQAGETSIEHIQLESGAYKILHTLGNSPTRLHQEGLTLCEDPPMDRKTVRRHLTALAEHGLIEYKPRNKKGAGITQKGKDYLNSLPK